MTVCFFDADCGICTAIAQWAERVAPPGAVVMRPNTEPELPPGITPEITDKTIVVVAPDGRVLTRVRAVAEVMRALPGGRFIAWVLLVPGLRQLFGVGYDFFAARRRTISQRLGMGVCRVPPRED